MILSLAAPVPAGAGDLLGIGFHGGLMYDVGNLSSLHGASYEGQHSVILGIGIKLDVNPFFLKLGTDTTIGAADGVVRDGTAGKLEGTDIQYTSLPAMGGLNFRIRDRGMLYLGFGGSYIIGTGSIKTSAGTTEVNEYVWAVGFLTGVQLRLDPWFRVYVEWEYLDGRSDPVANAHATKTWDDFPADYTGHRIKIGVAYYAL